MILTSVPAGKLLLIPLGIWIASQARFRVIRSPKFISTTSLRYSVDTLSCLPSSAACSVCQARVAHLTRTGNSETPEKTASFPSSARSPFVCPVVTSLWNTSKSFSASALLFPFRIWVIIDADAFDYEREHARALSRRTDQTHSGNGGNLLCRIGQ